MSLTPSEKNSEIIGMIEILTKIKEMSSLTNNDWTKLLELVDKGEGDKFWAEFN